MPFACNISDWTIDYMCGYCAPGQSLPVQNLTTDSLRYVSLRCDAMIFVYHLITPCSFLNNAQSAADSAHFMANVKFDEIEEDLTAPNHPWIYYGVRAL